MLNPKSELGRYEWIRLKIHRYIVPPQRAPFFTTHLSLRSIYFTGQPQIVQNTTYPALPLFPLHSIPSYLLGVVWMALLTFLPEQTESEPKTQVSRRKRKQQKQKQKPVSSWDQIKNLLTCKQIQGSRVHDPSKNPTPLGYSKLGSSCSSLCSFKDVVHGNTRVVHRPDNCSPESSAVGQQTGLLSRKPPNNASTRSLSSRGMQFRKLSGCYECHMIVDPSR